MFRRKRSASHGPINPNPSQSAQTAAVQAFRASQASNDAKLSSSAAAAALRKHSPKPTSVEDVQTKRMLQRQRSATSLNTEQNSRQARQGELRRSSSSGSMTTRTFRRKDQSPVSLRHVGPPDEIIPVPPIPQGYREPAGSHRRAISVGTPYRAVSPRDQIKGMTRRTHDRPQPTQTSPTVSGGPMWSGTTSPISDLERQGSRNSVNFSYPRNARPQSPRQSPNTSIATESGSGQTQSLSETREPETVHEHAMQPTTRPVGKKKDTVSDSIVESDASSSNIDGQAAASVAHDTKATKGPQRSQKGQRSTPSGLNVQHRNITRKEEENTSPQGNPMPAKSLDSSEARNKFQFPAPKRRPSTVHEEVEKQDGNDQMSGRPLGHGQGGFLVETTSSSEHSRHTSPDPVQEKNLHQNTLIATQKQPNNASRVQVETKPGQPCSASDLPEESQDDRPPSLSPTRSTRFSDRLEIVRPGEHLHDPPSRSKSPAKSALKNAHSSRGVSLDHSSSQFLKTDAPSETSEGTSMLSDEGPRTGWKKKAVKVSFEDEAEILGSIASPPTSPESPLPSSPRSKFSAYRVRGDFERDQTKGAADADEFEAILKPRPALPSFGSIRGRKRFTENDRIIEGNRRSFSDSAAFGQSLSSDYALGELLRPENRHDKTTVSNQPMPPEVTSIEGTGYESSTSDDSSSDGSVDAEHRTYVMDEDGAKNSPQDAQGNPQSYEDGENERVVPIIALQPATPMLGESSPSTESRKVPGESPSARPNASNHNHEGEDSRDNFEHAAVEGGLEGSTIHEDESESDSGESIYSDAAEDMSELEGDGFGSINAIVADVPSDPKTSPPSDPSDVSHNKTDATDISAQPEGAFRPSANTRPPPPGIRHRRSKTIPQNIDLYPPRFSTRDTSVTEHPQPAKRIETREDDPFSGSNTQRAIPQVTTSQAIGRRRPLSHIETSNPSGITKAPQEKKNSTAVNGHIPPNMNITYAPLYRSPSNGSDSSSSFKRMRPPASHSGRHVMRRTMRTTSGELSSELPTQILRPPSIETRPTLRTTLRGPKQTPKKPSPFSGFGKAAERKPPTGKFPGSAAQFKSRIVDSSGDESDGKLRPVRGIPRRRHAVDGDSTELEDSSDNDAPRNAINRPRSNRLVRKNDPHIAAAIAGTAADYKLNSHEPGSIPMVGEPEAYLPPYYAKPKRGVLDRLGFSKRGRREEETRIRKSKLDSATRRDTPLERSHFELERIRNTDHYNNAEHTTPNVDTSITSPSSSKAKSKWHGLPSRLQKQGGKPSQVPLPALPSLKTDGTNPYDKPFSDDDRPHTSDGVSRQSAGGFSSTLSPVGAKQPAWATRFLNRQQNRHEADSDLNTEAAASDIGPSTGFASLPPPRKKSKFPRLKKVLGLKD